LQGTAFQPEQITLMTAAFDHVCRDLGLAERDDALRDIVARAIIACAETGEFDSARLRERAHQVLKA
jgi:hypothetical protein